MRALSGFLVALGVLYALATPVVIWLDSSTKTEFSPSPAIIALLLVSLSVGPAGFLELARKFSPIRADTGLDRTRRWLGSLSFALAYPAIWALVYNAFQGPEQLDPYVYQHDPLIPFVVSGVGGFLLGVVGLVCALASVSQPRP